MWTCRGEPDAEPFLISQGFSKQGSVTFGEIELADIRERMRASAQQLESGSRKLPENARVVGLNEAGVEEVTRLYAEHIAHMEPLIGLRETFRIDQQTDSVALLINDKLAGFLLARLDNDGTLHVPAWVVNAGIPRTFPRLRLIERTVKTRARTGRADAV